MKLLVAIVQSEDAARLCGRLNARGVRATRINTAGGFLARGNVTVLIGVEDDQIEAVMEALHATCRTRRSFINAMPWGADSAQFSLSAPAPLEVEIGGATVFTVPVKRFLHLQADVSLPALQEKPDANVPVTGGSPMDLVLAIVQNEDADAATRALLAAGYRLTRINTVGTFLRRGNATLLIGAERSKTDDVLRIIQASCRVRPEAAPDKSGMPAYGATVFVVEASQLTRI